MPTYSYECKKCEHGFEIIQRMSDDVLVTCPECNKDELKKIIVAGGGFRLKGNGWFKSGGY
jgi:putative FmdB family regulatory protein|tara:strand:+ start:54 stop:236 length:183 start_codon:yes stop_codon:yes gene_type:complete